MKKSFAIAFLLACLVSVECMAQFSRLSIDGYGIKSISPESFSSVNGKVWLDVANPDEGFVLSMIHGTVYKKGMPFVKGTADDVRIASGNGRVVISGNASLFAGVSLWSVLGLLAFDPDDYTIDVSMTVRMDSGAVRTIEKKGMPVSVLLKLK